MKQSLRIGRFHGAPVGVHWSVALIFGLVAWELAGAVFPSAYAGTTGQYWTAAIVAAVLFFASLLAHELSHAIVARRHGVQVRSITLWLFGGVAQLGSDALSPGADFRIASAGPAVSFALVGVFAAIERIMSAAGIGGLAGAVPGWLWRINLLLAVFNLIPAAPLDGGRILRSGIWAKSHDRTRASVLAADVGRGFGIVMIGVGIALTFFYNDAFGLWPAFLGWFLYAAAGAEKRYALTRRALQDLHVGDVMIPHPPAIASSTTIAELVHRHLPWYRVDAVAVVGPTGWLEGIVSVDRIKSVPPLQHAYTPVGAVEYPISQVPVGRPEEPIQELLQKMTDAGDIPAVILDESNRLAGIVTPEAVDRRLVDPRVPAGSH